MHDSRYWREQSAVSREAGRLQEAAEAARHAIAIDGNDGEAWSHLAHALRWSGDLAAAQEAALTATRVAPGCASGWFNLGAVQIAKGELDPGIAAYRQALSIRPRYAEAWSNLGIALGMKGNAEGELQAYRAAVDANPLLPPVWNNLGGALKSQGVLDEAERAIRKALELSDDYAPAWVNLGSLLRDAGRCEEAEAACARATGLDPSVAEAWSNLGNVLADLERYDEAIFAHRRAEHIRPDDPDVLFNLGFVLKASGDAAAAVDAYCRAIASPRMSALPASRVADLHWNLSLALLTQGSFIDGWREYDWRWRRSKAEAMRHRCDFWDGATPAGLRMLVWGEQGVGDEILYAGMIPELLSAGVDVTLECEPRLAPLFTRSLTGVHVTNRGAPLPSEDYDVVLPMASLGGNLRRSWEAFPLRERYLLPAGNRVAEFDRSLRQSGGQGGLIGLSWRSRNEEYGGFKSSDPRNWAPLLGTGDHDWLNLQYGDTCADLDLFEQASGVRPRDVGGLDTFRDLDGLAAAIAACDLVITVSNVTAHLAGAVGCPVWLMLPRSRGKIWYWFDGRDDSPWYPSMRIFRQEKSGDWPSVIARVTDALRSWSPPRPSRIT